MPCHKFGNCINTYVVRLTAQSVVLTLVSAGEIMIVGIVVGVLVIKVRPTIRALQQTGEHIFLHMFRFTVFCIAKPLLDAHPDRAFNDWLIHETTKMIPKVAFDEEHRHLKSVPELGVTEIIPKVAIIRKNNIVFYGQNRYQMPKGTYAPGRKARIEVDEEKSTVLFYDYNTEELLEEHRLELGIGKSVRNTHPERDRRTQHQALVEKVLNGFGRNPQAEAFVEIMLAEKPRYTRDQLSIVAKTQEKYDSDLLLQAVSYCMERELYTATDFRDALAYFSVKQDIPKSNVVMLPLKYSIVTAEQRPLTAYANLLKGCDRRCLKDKIAYREAESKRTPH